MNPEFISMDYILTFAGMVAAVILLTNFTKKLFDRIVENKTKWLVAGYSLMLCIVAAIWKGKFASGMEILETCFIWLVNSVVVWYFSMKAYEETVKKIIG